MGVTLAVPLAMLLAVLATEFPAKMPKSDRYLASNIILGIFFSLSKLWNPKLILVQLFESNSSTIVELRPMELEGN